MRRFALFVLHLEVSRNQLLREPILYSAGGCVGVCVVRRMWC